MARLTYEERKRLPRRDFAFPSRAPRHGSYPIEDLVHARAALRYGARYLSPSEYRKLRAKIFRRFPSIDSRSRRREERY